MASSPIITSIHSALVEIDTNKFGGTRFDKRELKIGLMSLNGLILCLGELGEDDAQTKTSLFSNIEDFLARLFLLVEIQSETVEEVHSFTKQVGDELSTRPLTVDEVVRIADSILGNIAEYLTQLRELKFERSTNVFEVIDAFEVHIRFMRNFLRFAVQVGVDLQNVLVHIHPNVINAAGVFVKHKNDGYHVWCRKVESKCSMANLMVADPQFYQAYAQALTSSKLCCRQSQDHGVWMDFLDSLISILWDVLRRLDLDSRRKDQFKVLYEGLRFSRTFLKNSGDEEIVRIGVLIYDAGVLICYLHEMDLERLSDLLDAFQAEAAGTNPPMASDELDFEGLSNLQVSDGTEKGLKDVPALNLSHHQSPLSNSTPQVVGFQDDEVALIENRLTRGSKQLRMIPICGMAGLGKTTFALKLYNYSSIVHHFHARAWCTISQEMDKKKVLLQLLNQIQPGGDHSQMTEDDLANNLRRNLKQKRYLILLDDVWAQVWTILEASFPNDSTGSRIILTSRLLDVAPPALLDEQPHLLRLRTDSECCELLQMKLFHKEGWGPDLGMKLAKICKGLPLTVVIVAGLLATTEHKDWNGILHHLDSGGVTGAESALELSYRHLPDYLKTCFLYFGAFPEDDHIRVKRLIRLWIAEGFVLKNESKRIEDVAQEYMVMFIERSLVMVVKRRSSGGVKTCHIHDLLHDFCLIKAKKENLFHPLQQRHDQLSNFNEPPNLQRLSIHSFPIHFKKSGLFCPRALSILFFSGGKSWMDSHFADMSFLIQIFQLLMVLDICQIYLTNGIPSEIELLTRLRYFSVRTTVSVIPSSVGNLSNLETFIAYMVTDDDISLPSTIWNLHKLKYLYIKSGGDGFTFPDENLDNFSNLLELETLRGVLFYSGGSMEKLMSKFPNIRRLKCSIKHGLESTDEFIKFVVPGFLKQLESLTMQGIGELKCEFGSTENLRKVKLEFFELSREEIAVLGKLPNLEVLKLSDIHFPENTLVMEEEEFKKLRVLKLYSSLNLERWIVIDDQLPCLQKLVLNYCRSLSEIPSCLETLPTLEEIEAVKCSSTLDRLIRNIVLVQKDYGNMVQVNIIS